MFHDAREVSRGEPLEYDLCIVGSGPAGITLAREFLGTKTRVCILEGGGLEVEPESQQLYEGATSGQLKPERHYLSTSRIRCFGGTSFHWGGFCRPLEAIDFRRREWVPESGWPIGPEDLAPFYSRAAQVLSIPSFVGEGHDPAVYFPGRDGALHVGRGGRYATTYFHQSYAPTRFGEAFRPELKSSENVHVYFHANALSVELERGGGLAREIPVKTLTGQSFSIRARAFVLATGGIENARLLLLSRSVQKDGIGNGSGRVGRYFMDHPMIHGGWIFIDTPLKDVSIYENWVHSEVVNARIRAFLRPSDETQAEERMVNHMIHLLPEKDADPKLLRTGEALRHLRGLAGWEPPVDGARLLRYRFLVRTEQLPEPSNRVTLDEANRDALGLPRPKLDWKVSELERRTVDRGLRVLAEELGAAQQGRIWQERSDAVSVSSHHMGTTRMSADARSGVVDRNLRVHGVSNLYVAGSSVFPTSGYCNPTLSIVALSLRLAGHLRGKIGGGKA
jgi:choline dehydrogenase-like flavoprotein